jgi:hypothetical protein
MCGSASGSLRRRTGASCGATAGQARSRMSSPPPSLGPGSIGLAHLGRGLHDPAREFLQEARLRATEEDFEDRTVSGGCFLPMAFDSQACSCSCSGMYVKGLARPLYRPCRTGRL